MISKERIKDLKSRAIALKPFTNIGKNGFSENSIIQIKNYLKANKLCKIKVLRSFLDESGMNKKSLAEKIAQDTESELIQLVGLTVVLYKN